jgi:hypothetical protein
LALGTAVVTLTLAVGSPERCTPYGSRFETVQTPDWTVGSAGLVPSDVARLDQASHPVATDWAVST